MCFYFRAASFAVVHCMPQVCPRWITNIFSDTLQLGDVLQLITYEDDFLWIFLQLL